MGLYPKRSSQQSEGSKAQHFVFTIIGDAGGWIPRRQDEDFGIDLEMEVSKPDVRGELVKVQIKSEAEATTKNGKIRMQLPRTLVATAENLRIPVLLVWVDRGNREAYYLWVQRWFLRRRADGDTLKGLPELNTVWVPLKRTLRRGLRGELVNIARWKTSEQLTLSLAATIRTAIAINDASVLRPLNNLLANLAAAPLNHTVDEVIDSVLALKQDIWGTDHGNEKARFLYEVCRTLGGRFTRRQVIRMVARGGRFSKTGVNALAQLYDHHFDHLRKMDLPQKFRDLDLSRVAFFCALREAHAGQTGLDLVGTELSFTAAGWRIAGEVPLDKWASRGDCAILDFFERVRNERP